MGPRSEAGGAGLGMEAAAFVSEGISVSMAHDVVQAPSLDGTTILNREVLRVSETGASDRYQYTGSYHGIIHSHLDAVDCHIIHEGKGYNGVSIEDIEGRRWLPEGQH